MRLVSLGSALLVMLGFVSSARSDKVAPQVMARDLTADGLPLVMDAPDCVRVTKPELILPENKHDLMVMCEGAVIDTRVFGVQVGWARGKMSEKEIAKSESFKRWIKKTPAYLEWEETAQAETHKQFMTRKKVGGVAYACFNLSQLDDGALKDAEVAACNSLRPASGH